MKYIVVRYIITCSYIFIFHFIFFFFTNILKKPLVFNVGSIEWVFEYQIWYGFMFINISFPIFMYSSAKSSVNRLVKTRSLSNSTGNLTLTASKSHADKG